MVYYKTSRLYYWDILVLLVYIEVLVNSNNHWMSFDVLTVLFGITNLCDSTVDLKVIVGHCDLYFSPVILPYILNVIWCMNIIIWDYKLVWGDSWPKSYCRSLWPIFHGPVILCISRRQSRLCTRSLGLCDLYFIALWLCLISHTFWRLSVKFTYYDTVWAKNWPQSKYNSAWPVFHSLVVLPNIF